MSVPLDPFELLDRSHALGTLLLSDRSEFNGALTRALRHLLSLVAGSTTDVFHPAYGAYSLIDRAAAAQAAVVPTLRAAEHDNVVLIASPTRGFSLSLERLSSLRAGFCVEGTVIITAVVRFYCNTLPLIQLTLLNLTCRDHLCDLTVSELKRHVQMFNPCSLSLSLSLDQTITFFGHIKSYSFTWLMVLRTHGRYRDLSDTQGPERPYLHSCTFECGHVNVHGVAFTHVIASPPPECWVCGELNETVAAREMRQHRIAECQLVAPSTVHGGSGLLQDESVRFFFVVSHVSFELVVSISTIHSAWIHSCS